MALLLLRAQEPLQALQVIDVVLLPPWRVKDRWGSAVASPQAGALSGAQATGIGRGAWGRTVVQLHKQIET